MAKTEKTKTKGEKEDFGIKLEEMAKAGLHFGHRTSKGHPKMKPFLYGERNNVHIIDIEKTTEKLKEALQFIKELVSEGKTLLFVGTKVQVKDLVKEIAVECGFPYVNDRWLGGTFTNFKTVKKRIDYFKELEKKKKEGELEKYTKKEVMAIEKEIQDLEKKFGGIKEMKELPAVVFVLSMKKDSLAIKEARRKEINVVAISDTNTNPNLADYPIPANDDAISSVRYILEKVKEVILSAKLKAKSEKQQPET